MSKITVSEPALREMLFDAERVGMSDWRYGHVSTYHIVHEGKGFIVDLEVHAEDGVQIYGDTELTPAVKRERLITEWIAVQP